MSVLLSCVSATPALANPEGGTVVSGGAAMSNPAPGVLEIINDPGTIINWNEFSIGIDEITRFIQEGSTSSVLNRVTGANPSEILGRLLSNGQVWLINTNGIAFGKDAVVDTAGFVASTLGISNEDYLAGRFELGDGSRTGFITNAGAIIANGDGSVFLIAPRVTNEGSIRADNGDVVLAAGRRATLTSLDYDNIRFEVQSPDDRAVNLGDLRSMGGAVAAYAGQIDQRGTIEADRLVASDDGTIHLVADTNRVGGRLSVAGGNGQEGGRVRILGDDITLSGAVIDAAGDSGGGEVLVGGDYQGGGGTRTARNTSVDESTSIDASARSRGDGGRIIVWSDGHTESLGRLSARGGPGGGDGGLVETSGRGSLDFGGPADVSAPRGEPGTWLIDPSDIDIDSSKAASIEEALNEGSSVSVKTSDDGDGKGDISVNSTIHKSEGEDASLTLDAHNEIHVNAGIKSSSGKLDVTLKAGAGIDMNAAIDTNGGRLSSTISNPVSVTDTGEDTDTPDTDDAGDAGDESDTGGTDASDGEPETDTESEVSEGSGSGEEPVVEDDPADDQAGDEESADTTELAADLTQPVEPVESTEADEPVEPVDLVLDEPEPVDSDGQEPDITGETDDGSAINVAAFDDDDQPVIIISGDIVTGGGEISIDSGGAGRTRVSGTLDSSNLEEGETGGDIRVLGDEVLLLDEARVDASGDEGGGDVLIGGDYQGGNDEVRNARHTRVGADTSISADAVTNGDGGKVVVWADETTVFAGRISATGGSAGGNGGTAEVSGKQRLGYHGTVDLSADNGKWGTLLLDPTDVVIGAAGGDDGQLADDMILAGEGGALFNISASALATSLTDDTSIAAGNDITVENGSPVSWASASRLTLNAGNDILLNDDLDGGANGDITLIAVNDITTGAGDSIAGDDLVLNAGNSVDVLTSVNTLSGSATAGAFSVENTGALGLGAVSAGGDITITTTSPLTVNGTVTATGANSILLAAQGNTAADDLTINARVTATTGNIDLYAGDSILQQTPGSALQGIDTTTGNINIFAGTDYNGGAPSAGTVTGTFMQDTSALVTIYSPGGDVGISAPGDIVVNRVINDFGVGTSQSSITSDNGSITEQGVFTQIFGPDFMFSAATGIDLTNTPGNTNIGMLDASNSTSGDIVINNIGDLIITGLTNNAAGGQISITTGSFIDVNTAASSNNGDITLVAGSTGTSDVTFSQGMDAGTGNMEIQAGNDILSDNLVNPGIALAANVLSLSAPGEIGVRTDASSIAAESTVAGDITIVDNSGVDIATANTITGLTTNNGSISVTAGNEINVNQVVEAGQNGNVELSADGGDIQLATDVRSSDAGAGDGNGTITLQAPNGSIVSSGGRVESADGMLTARASGGITLDTTVANIDARSTVAGDINIDESDGVSLDTVLTTGSDINIVSGGTMNAGNVTAGGAGSVSLTATSGNVNVGLITAPGNVTINALDGNIEDLQDDLLLDIDLGGTLTLFASGNIGGNSPGGAVIDPAGALELTETPSGTSSPAPPVVTPTPAPVPDIPTDVINQILSLQGSVDSILEMAASPSDDREITFVEKRTQCL